ncbi:MAG: 5-formyltetrahydrofolate cyclo-ligase [Alphaproteobacteria bacterium]|nr:5-formyltetrahydrofolate cyclo-ligase [Alphaproteobacteria bacterium]
MNEKQVPQEQKQTYREQARLHRDRLAVTQSDYEQVIDVFFDYFNPPENAAIATYWPVGKEFDCRYLLDECLSRSHVCALPVIENGSRLLKFHAWNHDCEMKENALGILEPQNTEEVTPDYIIAPLLAFDQKGNRLGQGGGYYDATLAHLREGGEEVQFIGIGYAEQAVLFNLPVEEHDQKLDYMLTPNEVIEF